MHTNVLQAIIFAAGLEKPATVNGMTDYTDILDVIVPQVLSNVPQVFYKVMCHDGENCASPRNETLRVRVPSAEAGGNSAACRQTAVYTFKERS